MGGRLRSYEPLLITSQRLFDALAGSLLFLLLALIYRMYNDSYSFVAITIFFVIMVIFHMVGLYRSWRGTSVIHEINYLIAGCVLVYILLLSFGFLLKITHFYSRRVILTWMVFFPLGLGLERYILRVVMRYMRTKGMNIRRVIVAGRGPITERFVSWLKANPWVGDEIIGFFDDRDETPVCGVPFLGKIQEIPSYTQKNRIDIVYLALPTRAEEKIHWLMAELADSTVSVYIIPDYMLLNLVIGGQLLLFENIPVIALRETPFRGIRLAVKRLEDIVISLIVLLLASPIMIAVAIAIKITSGGPVLFGQWRYGLDGKAIKIYKFRTMNVCEDGYSFEQARRGDPRVTKIGSFLRRSNLDELPQFINVLQGRMSIVGPRPHPVAMNETYRKLIPGYMLRHKVRPGITGWAQVNGWRGETDCLEKMEERIHCDLDYLKRWSLLLDIKIIFLTIFGKSARRNAY